MSTLNTTNLKNPSSGSNNIVLGTDGATTLGTAKVTAITDSAGANSSTPAAIANGTAKAWVNFNGTGTVAIRASYNVSSITDNGVGDYTVNFTTALVDADYSVAGITAQNTLASNNGFSVGFLSGTTPTTTSFNVGVKNIGSAGGVDADKVTLSVFR